MKWITRNRPKIDRIACPWLIKNFVDKTAEFIYVSSDQVLQKAEELDAIPYDVPNVEYSHEGEFCTFDTIIKKHQLTDPALVRMSVIVRGADTDRHDIASQSSGLWAITAGLAYNIKNDRELLEKGMMIYDALYSWARHLHKEKHTQNPVDRIFIDVYSKFLKQKAAHKKTPVWVKELKEIIQDHIDANLSLASVSKSLDINPSYLSRKFSKYFNDLSFGEYVRKLRIEKAVELMTTTDHLLTDIAYLTGFSDQSHFTRIFKQHFGKSPSVYRKEMARGKENSKS